MKTVSELIDSIPEPYRMQVLKNILAHWGSGATSYLSSTESSAYSMMGAAFAWKNTPQGFDYWFDFTKTLND